MMRSIWLFFMFASLGAKEFPVKYVSVYGFFKGCDVASDCTKDESGNPNDYIFPEKIRSGDVIWVQSGWLPVFYKDCLPRIKVPFVLVVHHGDESFPTSHQNSIDIEGLIANPYVLHIFAQNCDYTGPQIDKISPIPLGIDYHTLAHGGGAFDEKKQTPQQQEAVLENIIHSLEPTRGRIPKALVEFHHHDTIAHGWSHVNRYLAPGETRKSIAEKIASSGVVDFMPKRVIRRESWRFKGQYAFSICPPGNGLDTLRVWEDLILGCICIVKNSPMDRLFEGLPVVIIQDWSEINEDNFTKWLSQYGDAFENPEYRKKLTLAYWMDKINQCTK